MTKDAFRIAEQRGYSKGYVAGQRLRAREVKADLEQQRKQRLLDAAFLAALPFAFTQCNWTTGGAAINTLDDRVDFAWRIVVRGLKHRRYA